MGLPGVRIPLNVFPNLQSALESCSALVETIPLSDEDVNTGLIAAFVCKNSLGDKAFVRIHRIPRMLPDGIGAIIEPGPRRLLHIRRQTLFLKKIQSTLIEFGALPPK